LVFGEGAIVWCVGKVMGKDGAREGFNFGKADGLPAEGFPSDGRGFHARANGKEAQRDLRG
jgi:hypothetical protein